MGQSAYEKPNNKIEDYIDRLLCKISHEIEFDKYGLAVVDGILGEKSPDFLSENEFCSKIEKAVIISESGMGKTSLLNNLMVSCLSEISEIFALSQYKNSPQELRTDILDFIEKFKSKRQSDVDTKPFILLDALDEAENITGEIIRYFSKNIKLDEIKLIITSKNRESAAQLISELSFKKEEVYKLTPLSWQNVSSYVEKHEENSRDFFKAITSKSIASMCSNPIGLEFVLQSYKEEGFYIKTIASIWSDGIKRLCDKTNPEKAITPNISAKDKMDCACWIAMIMALNDKSCVFTGIEARTPMDCVYVSDLAHKDIEHNFSYERILETVKNTALFSHDTLNYKSSFSHTTYFEHCAALGIRKFINRREWIYRFLRRDEKAFFQRFHGIVSRLALIDDDFRKEVFKIQPNLLLQFKDIVNSFEPKIFCKEIINYYTNEPEKSILHRWGEYSRFWNIGNENNRTCEYLLNLVQNETMNKSKLELIIDIARDCSCHDFADVLVDIVIGKFQLTEDIYNLKISALRAMTNLNNSVAKKRLYKEFDLSKEDDSRDELKGYYLINLWPEILPTGEMTKLLTIPKMNRFSGRYSYFLSYILPEKLGETKFETEDIVNLLRWSLKYLHDGSYIQKHERAERFIYSWCWQFAEHDNVANLLADGYLSSVDNHECPFPDIDKLWNRNGYDFYLSPEKFQQNRDSRFKVLLLCLQKNKSKKKSVFCESSAYPFSSYFRYNSFQLFSIEDAGHMFRMLIEEKDEKTRELWKDCIKALVPKMNIDDYQDEVDELSLIDPDFIGNLKSIKTQYENRTAESLRRNEHIEKRKVLQEKCRERRYLKYEEDIKEVLKNQGSDWKLFKNIIDRIEFLERESGNAHSDFDVSKSEFWKNLNENEKEKLLKITHDYLVNQERFPDRDDRNVYLQPSQALCLLHSKANNVFDNLSKDIWDKFADEIVRIAFQEEVKPILEKLSSFEEIFENSLIRIMKKREEVFSMYNIGEFLTRKIVERIMNEFCDIDEYKFHNILCELTHYTKHIKAVKEFVEKNYADIEKNRRYSYLFLMLVLGAENYSEVIRKINQFSEECMDILSNVIHQYQYKEMFLILPLDLLSQFYIWLNENYPANKEPLHEESPTGIDEIYFLKSKIIGVFQNSNSSESIHAIEEIIKAFPNENYSNTYNKCYENVQEALFKPIEIETIKKLYNARISSIGFLIETEKDLLRAVDEVINEYQEHLQGERWNNVRYLWSCRKVEKKFVCCPKYEKDFSDDMAQFIKNKLEKEYQLVANREVKISEKSIPDFLIQLVRQNEKPLELMIEVKCIWNEKLKTAIKDQLVEKYLKNSDSKIGIYVLAWFESDKWTEPDDDRVNINIRIRKKGKEEAKILLEEQAREQNGYDIRAIVVDCSLK